MEMSQNCSNNSPHQETLKPGDTQSVRNSIIQECIQVLLLPENNLAVKHALVRCFSINISWSSSRLQNPNIYSVSFLSCLLFKTAINEDLSAAVVYLDMIQVQCLVEEEDAYDTFFEEPGPEREEENDEEGADSIQSNNRLYCK